MLNVSWTQVLCCTHQNCIGHLGITRFHGENDGVKKAPRSLTLLLSSFGLATAVVLIVLGFLSAETGREALGLPTAIESTDPIRGSVRVPAQSSVFVDLIEGYTGVFIIDGVEIETINLSDSGSGNQVRGQQVDIPPVTVFEPGNATLTFTPSEGAKISKFAEGRHTVKVVFWRVIDGRDQARSYTWDFNVF